MFTLYVPRSPGFDSLSLHDALPISAASAAVLHVAAVPGGGSEVLPRRPGCRGRTERKSTRLNSRHANISYAVFCLKKKKTEWVGKHLKPSSLDTSEH